VVYGSGFEGRPGLLARLARGRTLLGNRPAVVAAIKDPRRFFPMLARLGIPHPVVRYAMPAKAAGWLVKRIGGAGGTHVRWAGVGSVRSADYFQGFQPGEPASVLFLADGQRAVIIGFNRQWVAPPRAGLSFLYGGAVGRIAVPPPVESGIRSQLNDLVAATGLVGLNGLDFLLRDEEWSVLEINPRPTATAELYDADFPRGLLEWHIRATRGELPGEPVPDGPARAHAILLAPAPWMVAPDFQFPEWCRDLPDPGHDFSGGDPVCTVHAAASSPERALQLVRQRTDDLSRSMSSAATEAVQA